MNLEYDITGTGPSLLLLHGALISQAMWQPQQSAFSAYYQVITCNLPAHGSSPDVSGAYTISKLSERVLELLDRLGLQAVRLCGHSLGGMVAQQLAATQPRRIRQLVLAETSFGTRNTVWERLQTALARPFLRLIPQRLLVELSARQYGARSPETARFIRREMTRYDHRTSVRVMNAAFRFAGKNQLRRIQASSLVLVAAENRQTHSQGRQMTQLIPEARLEIIPRAHHLLNLDNPEVFNHKVLAFLDDG